MTITYHAGRRIQGLGSDLTATALPAGSVGGWVELGRTTLSGTGSTISVSSLPNKRYYMVLVDKINSGEADIRFQFNGDTGSNYAHRISQNGGAELTGASVNSLYCSVEHTYPEFYVGYIANKSDKEKLLLGHVSAHDTATNATNAPKRAEIVGKWSNTSNPINQIDVIETQTGTFGSGAEVVVLGYDPADTHTSNFWTELASVSGTGSSTTLSSGTITAKKYLWIQTYLKNPDSPAMRFNSDSGTNYARRGSLNGAADYTVTSTNQSFVSYSSNPSLTNYFVINNQSNEKLCIWHSIGSNTVGAGNAPNRKEEVFKWTNTSNQITQIDIINSSANHNSASIMKVWGAD